MSATSSLLVRDVSADGNFAIFMGSLDCLSLNMETLGSFEGSRRRTLEASRPKFTLCLPPLRRLQILSSPQFTVPVCPKLSQLRTLKHDVLINTSSSPFRVCLRNSHAQLLPTLFLQVFKSYYPLQQNCLICLLHNGRVLGQ